MLHYKFPCCGSIYIVMVETDSSHGFTGYKCADCGAHFGG